VAVEGVGGEREAKSKVWELNGEAQFPKAGGRDCRMAAFGRDIVKGSRRGAEEIAAWKGRHPCAFESASSETDSTPPAATSSEVEILPSGFPCN